MALKKPVIIELLNGIREFNHKVSDNPLIYYCKEKETFHSCIETNCKNSYDKSSRIRLFNPDELWEFEGLRSYFKENFHLSLIKILDEWPDKNRFPSRYSEIKNFQEHKKLLKLYSVWKNLNQNKKIDQVFQLDQIQNEYQITKKVYNQYREVLKGRE